MAKRNLKPLEQYLLGDEEWQKQENERLAFQFPWAFPKELTWSEQGEKYFQSLELGIELFKFERPNYTNGLYDTLCETFVEFIFANYLAYKQKVNKVEPVHEAEDLAKFTELKLAKLEPSLEKAIFSTTEFSQLEDKTKYHLLITFNPDLDIVNPDTYFPQFLQHWEYYLETYAPKSQPKWNIWGIKVLSKSFWNFFPLIHSKCRNEVKSLLDKLTDAEKLKFSKQLKGKKRAPFNFYKYVPADMSKPKNCIEQLQISGFLPKDSKSNRLFNGAEIKNKISWLSTQESLAFFVKGLKTIEKHNPQTIIINKASNEQALAIFDIQSNFPITAKSFGAQQLPPKNVQNQINDALNYLK